MGELLPSLLDHPQLEVVEVAVGGGEVFAESRPRHGPAIAQQATEWSSVLQFVVEPRFTVPKQQPVAVPVSAGAHVRLEIAERVAPVR
jgi:hypothetical protein